MAKEAPVGIRLDPKERRALEAAAASDDRPVSTMGRKILVEWLADKGWLKTGRK